MALSPSDQPAQAAQALSVARRRPGEGVGAVSATGPQKPAVPQSQPPVDVIAGPGVINQESGWTWGCRENLETK